MPGLIVTPLASGSTRKSGDAIVPARRRSRRQTDAKGTGPCAIHDSCSPSFSASASPPPVRRRRPPRERNRLPSQRRSSSSGSASAPTRSWRDGTGCSSTTGSWRRLRTACACASWASRPRAIPFVVLEIASPDTLKRADYYRGLQRRLYFQDGAPTESAARRDLPVGQGGGGRHVQHARDRGRRVADGAGAGPPPGDRLVSARAARPGQRDPRCSSRASIRTAR